uniref:Uncharacterized protein n=1 Tax=Glossina palpalis gambiensis TaxID=67801 RepID=A0A1B0B2V6_9MUSC
MMLALVGGGFAEFCLNSIFVMKCNSFVFLNALSTGLVCKLVFSFKILTLTFYHNLVRLSWKKVLKEISTVLKCFSLVDEVV